MPKCGKFSRATKISDLSEKFSLEWLSTKFPLHVSKMVFKA
jgi:hypothetical protein